MLKIKYSVLDIASTQINTGLKSVLREFNLASEGQQCPTQLTN